MMLYLLGANILAQKTIHQALTEIYGIGLNRSRLICEQLGFGTKMIVGTLNKDQLYKLSKYVENTQITRTELKKKINRHILQLKHMRSYRGIRHSMQLPVRGQRTRTNAKTQKRIMKKTL